MKEFAFRGLINSVGCGSQITGEEKFKVRKDGDNNRHIYYHCSGRVQYGCPEPFAKEPDIVQGLIRISGNLLTDLTEVRPGLRQAIDKYVAMMRSTPRLKTSW